MNLRGGGLFFVACMAIMVLKNCYVDSSLIRPAPTIKTVDDRETEIAIDELLSMEPPPGRMQWSSSNFIIVELDILYTAEQWESRLRGTDRNTKRTRREIVDMLWPNATVPFIIRATFNAREAQLLYSAMDEYQRHTCIQFRNATKDEIDYVDIVSTLQCAAHLGRIGGVQKLSLEAFCHKGKIGVFVHELGHVVGLQHEHNRPDRDQYVFINESNISEKALHNFLTNLSSHTYHSDVKYNYLSVMHYGEKAFSINERPTIIPKRAKYFHNIGKSKGLTFEDIKLINIMYECAAHCPKIACPGDGFIGKDCRCWCPDIDESLPAAPCVEYSGTCGGAMYASQKPLYIRSPGYPNSYPSRSNCLWTLQTKSGNGSIFLQIKNFSTEECCDSLFLYDNTGYEKNLSGATALFEITLGPRAIISFTSDDLVQEGGFEITFTALSAQKLQHTVDPVKLTKSSDPCYNYVVLNDSWRNVIQQQGQMMCDRNLLLPDTWYRIMPPAGNQIPETVPPVNSCGTEAPMWLNGSHPTIEARSDVERQLCAHWNGHPCRWSTTVQVLLCSDGYYVYKAPVSVTPLCNSTWCAVSVPPPPPHPVRFVANSYTIAGLNHYCGKMSFTQDGHILIAAGSDGLIEYTADGRELSRWQLPSQTSIDLDALAVLSDGRVAVSFWMHNFVVVLKRRCYSIALGDAWKEDRHLTNFSNKSLGLLSAHGDVLTVVERYYDRYLNAWIPWNTMHLLNVTSGARLATLDRDYAIKDALITAHLIITIGLDDWIFDYYMRAPFVDGYSRASDLQLWRYEVHSSESVGDMCTDYAGRVLYVLVLHEFESKQRLAAISLDDGKELRRYAHSFSGSFLYKIAIGRVHGHNVLAVAQRNDSKNIYRYILTVHPGDDV